MPKVLISDKLSESAVDIFKKNKIETIYKPGLSHDELLKEINNYDGLAIRSATKVTEEVFRNAKNLKISFCIIGFTSLFMWSWILVSFNFPMPFVTLGYILHSC